MAEKQREGLNIKDSYVDSTSNSKEDFNFAGSSSQPNENDGACSMRGNPQPIVEFSTVSRLPIFRRLRYGQRYPGIIWERHERYNEFLPRQYIPDDFESDSSLLSREYQVMDYMAFGYDSDEYYEADDEDETARMPIRERRPVGRRLNDRYFEELGRSVSFVRYAEESGLSFAFPPPINISPRPAEARDYVESHGEPHRHRYSAENEVTYTIHTHRGVAPPASIVQNYGGNGLAQLVPPNEGPRLLLPRNLGENGMKFFFSIPQGIEPNRSHGRNVTDRQLTQSAPSPRQSIVRHFVSNRLVRSEPIPQNIEYYDAGASAEEEYSE